MHSDYAPQSPDVAPLTEGLASRSFPPGMDGEQADAATAAFTRTVEFNFYEKWLTDQQTAREAQLLMEDQQRMYGVYLDPGFAALEPWGDALEQVGFSVEHPVGTFVDYDKTLNTGGAEPLPARLITGVTVTPSFRRRGILKHMMTDSLNRAVAEGLAVTVLTASEGSIYGRFGFGVATRDAKVQVDLGQSFADRLQLRAGAEGQVLMVDPTKLESTIKEVFADFHTSTRGSLGRHAWYWKSRSARWDPQEHGGWNRSLRAAVHVLDDGSIGGYVTYSHRGWDTEPSTIAVGDLIVRSEVSRRELWRYLGGLDTVERATLRAPVQDPTPHALTNARAWSITGVEDVLWVRVLNPVAALEARAWSSDGEFSLSLTDPQGIAAGTFTVSVSGGIAQVTSTQSRTTPQHFSLDVETLGSLYLGDVSVLTMRDAGRITADDDADWGAFAATFDLATAPFCATHF